MVKYYLVPEQKVGNEWEWEGQALGPFLNIGEAQEAAEAEAMEFFEQNNINTPSQKRYAVFEHRATYIADLKIEKRVEVKYCGE